MNYDPKIFDESIFTPRFINKINLFELSNTNKLKRKICELLKNNGKHFVFLKSILSLDNFYKYEYKNILDALKDVFSEKEVFNFLPVYKLPKETDELIENQDKIEFDIVVCFNKDNVISDANYINKLDSIKSNIIENNKMIVPHFLYRLLCNQRCYFYPLELFLKKLSVYKYYDNQLKEIYKYCFKNDYYDDEEIIQSFKSDLALDEVNEYLNFTIVSGEESKYFYKKEIDDLIDFNLKVKDISVIFLRQNINFNIRFNNLMDEILDYFNIFILKNQQIKKIIIKNLPDDKKDFIDNIDKINFEDIIQTIIDPKFISNYHLSEPFKKEFIILAQYIFENQKFFLDNIDLTKSEENYSNDLKKDILEDFKYFLNKLSENKFDIIFQYYDFISNMYKSIKKDKSIILKIFNQQVKNILCFFSYFKINEESEEIEFLNNSTDSKVIVIPIDLFKEKSFFLAKSDFSNLEVLKMSILIMINILQLIHEKPEIININLDITESIRKTGFYNKKDLADTIELLEIKYKTIKDILDEENLLLRKQNEIAFLKKHKVLNSIKLAIVWLQKVLLLQKYYKFLNIVIDNYDKKLSEKEIKDKKFIKELKKESSTLKNVETENENKRIANIIDNLKDDERKLFSIIYNCIKNNGFVEYKDKKLKVEIYLKSKNAKESPQMFIFLTEVLNNLIKMNLLILDNSLVKFSEKISNYLGF